MNSYLYYFIVHNEVTHVTCKVLSKHFTSIFTGFILVHLLVHLAVQNTENILYFGLYAMSKELMVFSDYKHNVIQVCEVNLSKK